MPHRAKHVLGDPPTGMAGAMPSNSALTAVKDALAVPSGGSPDGTGGSPVLPSQELRPQFETCIGRLENRDLIRRLTFGGYVLLQPELLDAYGSAMVNTAKEEPDGLGSLAEEIALAGKFFVPKEQKITDPGQFETSTLRLLGERN